MTETTTTHQPDENRQDSNSQKRWFKRVKGQLTRENLDRGYYTATDHVWLGMNDIWWAITHPIKAIPRNIGQLTAIVVVASVFGTMGYIFWGDPNSARIDFEEPSSLFKVVSDHTIRPAWRFVRNAIPSSEETSETPSSANDVEEYDGQDYTE